MGLKIIQINIIVMGHQMADFMKFMGFCRKFFASHTTKARLSVEFWVLNCLFCFIGSNYKELIIVEIVGFIVWRLIHWI